MINQSATTMHMLNLQYLTFKLGEEAYAISLAHIKEIKGAKEKIHLSDLNGVPVHIKGLLHFQNEVVPVIDLKLFYQIESISDNKYTVLLIVYFKEQLIGLLVDEVLDIINLKPEDIKNPPNFFSVIDRCYIEGIATYLDQLIMVLNIERLLSSKSLNLTMISEHHEK